MENEDRTVLEKRRTYEPMATTVYGEPNERVTYGMS
jgi:hypothetical protein